MMDKGLSYGVLASVLVHGLLLAVGAQRLEPATAAPRVLEARLLAEEVRPERRVAPPPVPQPIHSARPAAPPPLQPSPPRPAPPRELVREASPPPVLSAPAGVSPVPPAMVATASTVPAAAAPGVAVPSGHAAQASAPAARGTSYVEPSYGASYLDNPKPGYPLMARRRGLEGTVRLDVRVSAEGIPIAVKLKESAGNDSLDEAAITAVWHWRFVPAKRGGEAVEGSVVVPVRFRLAADEGG